MTKKQIANTPYHDISSILELNKTDVQIQFREPFFEKDLLIPHRGSYYCIFFLTKGSINHMANLQYFNIETDTIVFSSPGIIKCWDQPSSKLEGYSLLFTADFFRQKSQQSIDLNQFSFFQWDAQHFLQLKKNEKKTLKPLFQNIKKEFYGQKLKNYSAIQSYLNILLIELERIYLNTTIKINKELPRNIRLANEYKCLVSQHFHQKRSVKDYAEMLNVTPNHLNDTVKSVVGKTASSLIHEMTLLEAKVLLHQTQITIAEIAFHLNFEDASYFGRFFKKQTGMTPYQYRKSNPANP